MLCCRYPCLQSLHKNENLLFKDFQDFLVRSQHLPEKRIPFYLLWVSRFHEFCSRQHLDGMGKEAVTSSLQDLAKDPEDWQVQQAKEAVRLYRYFKALLEPNRTEQLQANGQAAWQPVEDGIVRALRLRHRSYRTEQSYRQWLKRFGAYLGFKMPQSVNQQDLEHFLSHLAVDGKVSATTQRVALSHRIRKSISKSGAARRYRQASYDPHASPQLCDPPPGSRLRHPNGAGASWAFERCNNDDLYPCG